jgi:hypothetical protein
LGFTALACGGVFCLFFLAVGSAPDPTAGHDMLAEHARDTHSVTMQNDDIEGVLEDLHEGKPSEPFLVEGYSRKVYAAVTPRGEVSLRDYKTDDELPTKKKD